MNRIYAYIFTAILLSGILDSCSEEFLEIYPKGVIYEDMLATAEGINSLLVGCYAMLNDGNYSGPDLMIMSMRSGDITRGSCPGDGYILGEAPRMQWSTGNNYVRQTWQQYYTAVDRCNRVIRLLKDVTDMTATKKKNAEAEARFLRAHYYFYLKRLFIHIPWIDENSTTYNVPNTVNNDGVTWVNCWPNIAADMDYARKNLPEYQTDLARPNKWAADIYYAKIQMYRAGWYGQGDYPEGYNEALSILSNAIENGVTANNLKYGLLENFHDVFDAEYENSKESVWAVQLSVNDYEVGAYRNGNTSSFFGGMTNIWAPSSGKGVGFYVPTSYTADRYRTDPNGLPYLDMFETNPYRLKTDYGKPGAPALPAADTFAIDTIGVDPRLDWSVQRRNVPSLDYGYFPGKNWIRCQDFAGPYGSKKWYVWKSQVGIYTDAPRGRYVAINICIIRFSDVLLLAAECEARVGDLEKARTYVNQVRNRMVQNSESPRHWVKKLASIPDDLTDPYTTIFDDWDTVNAANYRISVYPSDMGPNDPFVSRDKALDAILFERQLELFMEGHSLFDLVRFERAEEVINDFLANERKDHDYLYGCVFTTIPDSYMPIPQSVIDNSKVNGKPTLTQNPGY